jgi:hypothetical protein
MATGSLVVVGSLDARRNAFDISPWHFRLVAYRDTRHNKYLAYKIKSLIRVKCRVSQGMGVRTHACVLTGINYPEVLREAGNGNLKSHCIARGHRSDRNVRGTDERYFEMNLIIRIIGTPSLDTKVYSQS